MSETVTLRPWTNADRDLAHRLHAERGWGPRTIWRKFVQSGITVAESTVREWIDPEACERRREAGRLAARRKEAERRRASDAPWLRRDATRRDATIEYRMVRIEALADSDISLDAIGRLLALDFGTPLTEAEVERVLETGEPPRHWLPRGQRAAGRTA